MNPILLQVHEQVDGMKDVSFNLKDVIYIVTIVVSIVAGWFKIKHDASDASTKIKNLQEKIKENKDFDDAEVIASGQRLRNAKKEIIELVKEKDGLVHKRIDKTQEDMKAYIEKSELEFKEINKNISDVKADTSELKGMLKTLIDKQN